MPTLTIKNIPPDSYKLLKQSAAANHRSLNSEIITCIDRCLRGRRLGPEALLGRARQLRRRTRRHPITTSEFNQAKRASRP